MNEDQKKILLGLGIALCLAVAGSRIYKFYQSLQPPFQVGECFAVSDPRVGTVVFKVVENDKANHTTDAVGTINEPFGLPGVKLEVPVRVKFDDLRDPEIKGVKCE